MKKYELTTETRAWLGKTLYRIRALMDFGDVKRGAFGGFVESEKNLDHEGNAWVSDDACVFGDAYVSGNAVVSGSARVFGDAWVYGDARVYDNARVYDEAWVYDNALVCGDARVSGNAWVYGCACVYDSAHVSGKAQVFGNTRIFGNVRVFGNAAVSGDARVCRSEHYLLVGPIGSRGDFTTFFRNKDRGVTVGCGCFTGSIEDFDAAVTKTHRDNEHGKVYRLAIEMARAQIDLTGDNEKENGDY